jgi:mannose-1-phosphate guanylyltransferase
MSRWAAVLAGGGGTRFWPLSTPTRPKQMLPLSGGAPLLVQTIGRIRDLIPPDRILVVTSRALGRATQRLLRDIPQHNLLLEPRAASTAPALAWATAVAARRDPSATVLSLHADWHVDDDASFRAVADHALLVAEAHDVLVTVGIVPSRPEVAYGYIVPGSPVDGEVRAVERFVEKPNAKEAAALIAAGALWNSGLFAWTAARFFAETRAVASEIAPHLGRLEDGDVEGFFEAVTPIAIDRSHFERSEHVVCVPGRFPWDDIGTWSALARVRPRDERGNVLVGDGYARDAHDCVVWADDGAVVIDGVCDLVVVRAHGVTLVTTRERADHLKDLLEHLPPEIRRRRE